MLHPAVDEESGSGRPSEPRTGRERTVPRICAECGTPLEQAWTAQRPEATLCPECTTLTDFAPPGYTD